MDKTIEVTFEVKTKVRFNYPDAMDIRDAMIENREDVVNRAKRELLENGIEDQLTWENMYWKVDDSKEATDFSEIGFQI